MKSENPPPLQHAVRLCDSIRLRLGGALFLRGWLRVVAPSLFASGALILTSRLVPGVDLSWLNYAAGVVLALPLLLGAIYASRRLPDRERVLMWCDFSGESGGLLAASRQTSLGDWTGEVKLPAPPRIRVEYRFVLLPVVLGLLFVLGAALVPKNVVSAPEERRGLDIAEEVARLEEKIELLEEMTLVPEAQAEEWRDALHHMQESNDARHTARMYELIETMNKRVDDVARDAMERMALSRENLEMLAAGMDRLADLPPSALPPDAGTELADLLRELARNDRELDELLREMMENQTDLAAQLQECMQNGQCPSPEAMRAVAEALRNSSAEVREKLARLIRKNLKSRPCANPGACGENGECANPGSCFSESDEAALAAWLEANAPGAESLLMGMGFLPGNGGISRGDGGPTPLHFIHQTAEFQGGMKEIGVTGVMDPEESTLLQRFSATPDFDENAMEASRTGSLAGSEGRAEQRESVIYPQHRAAVERYFSQSEATQDITVQK